MKTFFGLEVVDERLVRYSDIEKLPFFAFWLESSLGSTQLRNEEGETFVYLHDWEAFSRLFIQTGKHRYNLYK